jgi:hypothetical protein
VDPALSLPLATVANHDLQKFLVLLDADKAAPKKTLDFALRGSNVGLIGLVHPESVRRSVLAEKVPARTGDVENPEPTFESSWPVWHQSRVL